MELPATKEADAPPKLRLMTFGDLDGRTLAAKSARALIDALESDLGGADRLTAAERELVRRAALASAMAEHAEAQWLAGHGIDVASYCTLTNALRRLLVTVGLQRRSRNVTPDLADYLAVRVQPAPEADSDGEGDA